MNLKSERSSKFQQHYIIWIASFMPIIGMCNKSHFKQNESWNTCLTVKCFTNQLKLQERTIAKTQKDYKKKKKRNIKQPQTYQGS